MTDAHAAIQARLLALRQCQPDGDATLPLRRVEALLQRMRTHDASVQASVLVRAAELLDACERNAATAIQLPAVPTPASTPTHFAALLHRFSGSVETAALGAAVVDAAGDAGSAPLPASVAPVALDAMLDDARATWRELRAQAQLRQALAAPLEEVGPLNSSRLIARALEAMRETSPGYLQHLLAYLDALVGMSALLAPPASASPARKSASKPARKRSSTSASKPARSTNAPGNKSSPD
jgi:hypothetical protein